MQTLLDDALAHPYYEEFEFKDAHETMKRQAIELVRDNFCSIYIAIAYANVYGSGVESMRNELIRPPRRKKQQIFRYFSFFEIK